MKKWEELEKTIKKPECDLEKYKKKRKGYGRRSNESFKILESKNRRMSKNTLKKLVFYAKNQFFFSSEQQLFILLTQVYYYLITFEGKD